jgi:hypothetical protein
VNTRTVLHCLAPMLLLAALAARVAAQNPPPESKPQSSSEAAAAGNAQPAKKAKRVFTNDDFASTRGPDSSDANVDVSSQWTVEDFFPKDPVTAKEIAALQKFITPSYLFNLRQTKASVANLYLQQYKDVAFEGRGEWEERLFAGFECTRSAQGDYVKELDSASKDPEYRDLLTATRFSDDELRKIGALRARLIAGWQPVRVCNAKFGVIRKEGWQRAEEWLKTHPSKPN